jgi:AraC-like DNA-binding protein
MAELASLRESIARHAGQRTGLTATALPRVFVYRSPAVTEPLGEIVEPSLAIVVQGVKETALNGDTFTYRAGQFVIVSAELPIVGHVAQASPDEPLLGFVFRLRLEQIAELLLETAGQPGTPHASPPGTPPPGIAVSDASPELVDAAAHLLKLLDVPADAAALAPSVEREVLWRLLTGPQGAAVRQIGLADSRLTQLTRAIRWIRGNYDQPLHVAQLAGLATMSESSFHRHFRALTSMTPLQFQKQIRLHEARARLLTEAGDIAGVGYAVGYNSPSQFSREYRRMFGVPPGRDALLSASLGTIRYVAPDEYHPLSHS